MNELTQPSALPNSPLAEALRALEAYNRAAPQAQKQVVMLKQNYLDQTRRWFTRGAVIGGLAGVVLGGTLIFLLKR